MKKPTDFSYLLSNFLTKFLPSERGLSQNTISSYRDTFVLLLKYCKEVLAVKSEHITMASLNRETVLSFLEWLETSRMVSARTRNQRLAAIHSFFRYVQEAEPSFMHECQRILTIAFKKTFGASITYLSLEVIKAILAQPQDTTPEGRRDTVLLSLMYDTGARVQEKSLIGSEKQTAPLFTNRMKHPLTRAGVTYILKKHFAAVPTLIRESIPDKISPHVFRHSKAMHLLQAGVNLVYIRDILGHVDLRTTEIYARIDGKMKREALEKAYDPEAIPVIPSWQQDKTLLAWLRSFDK